MYRLLAVLSGFLALCLFSTPAMALDGSASHLKDEVSRVRSMTAVFEQTVTDEDGLVMEKYQGDLKLNTASRSFRMETARPEASLLNCDGKNIYYYEPALEQVTIYDITKIDRSSPFWIVLTGSDDDYKRFTITEEQSGTEKIFHMIPRESSGGASYDIVFDSEGLSQVVMKDAGGQVINYRLSERHFMQTLGSVEFVFTVPSGATVDDQR